MEVDAQHMKTSLPDQGECNLLDNIPNSSNSKNNPTTAPKHAEKFPEVQF